MDSAVIETTVIELATRPGHEKVRSLLYTLLRDGLGACSIDIDFETQLPKARGRIDALLGSAVFKVKSDLHLEREDAETQLARYLPEKEAETRRRYIGVAADGAVFRACELRDGRPAPLVPSSAPPPRPPESCWAGWKASWTCRSACRPMITPSASTWAARASPAPPTLTQRFLHRFHSMNDNRSSLMRGH